MRLISNKESVAKGEVSLLALVETIFAIVLVFCLSTHFNTLRWLAFAICISPLLLLRTKKSTRLGIKWFYWIDNTQYIMSHDAKVLAEATRCATGIKSLVTIATTLKWFLCETLSMAIVLLGGPAMRIAATVVSSLEEPWAALQAIPENWFKVAFGTDLCEAPEFIPSYHIQADSAKEALADFFEDESILKRFTILPGALVICFLPVQLYRWSLKATSIVYAPLVFVAYSTFSGGTDLRTKLELIKRGDFSRIRALYGVIAIIAFLAKVVLMIKWNGFVNVWQGNPITEFLAVYVAPTEIPKWQLAEVANSVLAVGAMFFARHALLRYELNNPCAENPVKHVLGFVSGVRWVLALYTIVCLAYITMREAHNWHWPALGAKWLPF